MNIKTTPRKAPGGGLFKAGIVIALIGLFLTISAMVTQHYNVLTDTYSPGTPTLADILVIIVGLILVGVAVAVRYMSQTERKSE